MKGKTADLTLVQKTLSDTPYKKAEPQKVGAESSGCPLSAVSKPVHGKSTGREECGWKR